MVSSCSILAFKNAESCVGEIARFFSYSPKRQRLLDKAIDLLDSAGSSVKAKKLKDACRTRWVQRIESYTTFLELHEAVHQSLEAIVHPHLTSLVQDGVGTLTQSLRPMAFFTNCSRLSSW